MDVFVVLTNIDDPKHVENDNVFPNKVENIPFLTFIEEVFNVDVFTVLRYAVEPNIVEKDIVFPDRVENVNSFVIILDVVNVELIVPEFTANVVNAMLFVEIEFVDIVDTVNTIPPNVEKLVILINVPPSNMFVDI